MLDLRAPTPRATKIPCRGPRMKTFVLCGSISAVAFMLAGIQAGLFRELPQSASDEVDSPQEKKETSKPAKARFPEDLVPASRAEPVPQAAPYDASVKIQRLVILKTTGALYQEWQEKLREEWLAESVEEASLAVVM